MKDRYKSKVEEQKGRSCLSKCGSLIKTLIVYAVAAAFIIPFIYETYTKVTNKGQGTLDQDFETVNMREEKERLTPEEIAKRAQDREREREEAFEAKMQAFEEEMGINDDVVNEDQDDEFASKINEEL